MVCPTCGNPVDLSVDICPFCGEKLDIAPDPAPKGGVQTLNLKEGLPSVEVARTRLELGLNRASSEGVEAVRIIHGYGSTGKGGSIKKMVAEELEDYRQRRIIRRFQAGERISRRLVDEIVGKGDAGNPGVTIVWL